MLMYDLEIAVRVSVVEEGTAYLRMFVDEITLIRSSLEMACKNLLEKRVLLEKNHKEVQPKEETALIH
ncbi:keratin, type I cytoskeletal 13-like [Clarias magur]|uniref:Keratin, type I cytoskeletal 13-like n=1 Tax=Clarias magur TaxID=1594786 RepID=A0A8J4XH20_CLAMG|nr:keratin, type I cytoskeletal 13-like [Clarias magur]